MERLFNGLVNSSDNTYALNLPAQEFDTWLDMLRAVFQGYSRWREITFLDGWSGMYLGALC